MNAREPTKKQREFIERQKLPVPNAFQQASTLISYMLDCPKEERRDRIRELRQHASLIGALVQVKGKGGSYQGTVVELVVRSSARRGYILKAREGAVPFLYEAVVESTEDQKRHHENISSLTRIRVKKIDSRQKLLFE